MREQTLWSNILTAAINLPANHPARESTIIALENAQRAATAAGHILFSEKWYYAAVEAIVSDDPAAQRFFIARLADAYRNAHAEIAWQLERRHMS